jgi:DNA-directed RNA polymerase alpha subunit
MSHPDAESDLPNVGAPATRALTSVGITRLEQLTEHSEAELLQLHGFGPRALDITQRALNRKGLQLRR